MALGSHEERLEEIIVELRKNGVFPGTIDMLKRLIEDMQDAAYERGVYNQIECQQCDA